MRFQLAVTGAISLLLLSLVVYAQDDTDDIEIEGSPTADTTKAAETAVKSSDPEFHR